MAADTVYTTIARVQNVLSATGVILSLDDGPPDAYGDALNEASDEIDLFAWERYSQAQLSGSDTVQTWCATLAAWFMRTRRGNPVPPGLQLRVALVREKLERVKQHTLSIPRLAQLKSYAPVMSVMTTVMRPYPRCTVEKTRGTGTPANYADTKSRDPSDKLGANQILDWTI